MNIDLEKAEEIIKNLKAEIQVLSGTREEKNNKLQAAVLYDRSAPPAGCRSLQQYLLEDIGRIADKIAEKENIISYLEQLLAGEADFGRDEENIRGGIEDMEAELEEMKQDVEFVQYEISDRKRDLDILLAAKKLLGI